MLAQDNDNLSTLLEPDVDEVAEELEDRFKRRIFYINFGDGVIALNPQTFSNGLENLPQNGKRYCSKRPIPNLPAHVYALAHKVYKDATSGRSLVEAHSILISGSAGSGKTEISEMLIAQFFREAEVSRRNDIPFILMKGLAALKRLLTSKSASGPTSSTASMVVTLYFGYNEAFKTAKITPHLLNPRHVIPHSPDRGYLNIFYDLAAALQNEAPGLSIRENIPTILQTLDAALTQLNYNDLTEHKNQWLGLIQIVKDLNIGENTPRGSQGSANSFLDSLLGLLLLATTQFDINQYTGQILVRSESSFALAAQLLGVSDAALYGSLMSAASTYGNLSPMTATQARDQLVHEVYSRLVMWLTEEINSKLPDVENGDVPIHIADLQSFLDHPTGNLEDLCHNMAAEYLQMLQNWAVFARERDACKAEGLEGHVVKKQRCEDIVDLAFTVPSGLLHQLEMSCNNSSLADQALVKSLDTHFKKRKDLYVSSKKLGPETFAMVHSHNQVVYQVNPLFRHQNLIIPNREAQKLLAASRNVTVQNVFKPAIEKFSRPDLKSYFSYVTYMRVQVNSLKEQIFGSVPHLVRCIRISPGSSVYDADYLKNQIKSAYLPDVIHHKKFGYSHWMLIPDFLRRYKMLDLSLLTKAYTPEEACKNVLRKAGILEKGTDVAKRCVFLSYWHKEQLDGLAEAFVWKVTLVQSVVRGHLTRKRLHEVIAARLRFRDEAASLRRGRLSSRRSSNHSRILAAEENELFENMIAKTLSKISDLSSSTWAKVIYMEEGTEIVKVYAGELSFFVTGSQYPFDGLELGLSYFHTSDRLRETKYIVGNLEQGIEMRRNSDGSLLVKRRCQLPVYVKHHGSQPVISADMLRTRGELPVGHFMKIFDMQEFYSLISLEMRKSDFSKASLRKACITVIRFGGSDIQILRMPCWIAVININALNVLDDVQELRSISLMTSQLTLIKDKEDDEAKEEQEEAKLRRQRKNWSRSDQRPQLKMKDANPRKIREELRNRGQDVSDHMKYSWEEGVVRKTNLNMDQLYERMRKTSSDVASNPSHVFGQPSPVMPVRKWAKINAALKDAYKELQRVDVEDTNESVYESL